MSQYRPNVAALMVNPRGQILICERFKIPGSWQFPQGGVDEGEDIGGALIREIEEEIGLTAESYDVGKSKGGYRYEYPESVRRSKPSHKFRFIGQEQTYYLCRVHEDYPKLDLMGEPREFSQSKWIHPEEFELGWLPGFKAKVYREVMKDFFGVELG
ncbi:RNA pyrophosphohydrolase [Akkermansiaceae bacterium]|nr:RNA pyrophosphohydrolase [bacterium]MDB4334474.1 RNA pyrophosphohydrolase [Akkermansiaceae bacterium]MDB4311739.1 RNA pyrophosphohydrolase [bacterium]MDB4364278.1 RNA pyrophosphohydrolase [Akkermansiaceae bacterium]MDB4369471.1 RNA pyrophosphohydrolase [Akkermansiaceae bacterium]